MSVPMAIAISGQLLLGQPVMVKPSEAEKNLVQSNTSGASGAGPYGAVDRKLYVGNLHFNMTETHLREVLKSINLCGFFLETFAFDFLSCTVIFYTSDNGRLSLNKKQVYASISFANVYAVNMIFLL